MEKHSIHQKSIKTSFDKCLETIPKLDSVYRTVGWVLELDPHQEKTESLGSLPMRGTLLPTRYTPGNKPSLDQDDEMITSVSVCESVLGTQGRGLPPKQTHLILFLINLQYGTGD